MSVTDVAQLTRPPQRLVFDRRLMGIAIVTEIFAVFLAYMVLYVPVLGPKLTREEVNRHWLAAVLAALIVVAYGIFVVRTALRARRADPLLADGRSAAVEAPGGVLPRIPASLRFERVSGVWVRRAGALSLATIPVSLYFGAPLWLAWFAILAPWVPIVVLESRYKYARNAMFTCFGLLVLLQLLHMVEHSTQLTQLLLYGGALARSHGVIGQLDFEITHMFADTTLWLALGALAICVKARNTWLWVAFAAASLHEVEHLYLFWMYAAQHTVYLSGGAAGILGHYGLIGTPLDRPYLHYTYNLVVFTPMLIAFWDEARWVDRVRGVSAARAAAAP